MTTPPTDLDPAALSARVEQLAEALRVIAKLGPVQEPPSPRQDRFLDVHDYNRGFDRAAYRAAEIARRALHAGASA